MKTAGHEARFAAADGRNLKLLTRPCLMIALLLSLVILTACGGDDGSADVEEGGRGPTTRPVQLLDLVDQARSRIGELAAATELKDLPAYNDDGTNQHLGACPLQASGILATDIPGALDGDLFGAPAGDVLELRCSKTDAFNVPLFDIQPTVQVVIRTCRCERVVDPGNEFGLYEIMGDLESIVELNAKVSLETDIGTVEVLSAGRSDDGSVYTETVWEPSNDFAIVVKHISSDLLPTEVGQAIAATVEDMLRSVVTMPIDDGM